MSSLLRRIEQGKGGGSDGDDSSSDNDSRLASVRTRRANPPGISTQRDTYSDLKSRVQNRLLAELDPAMDITKIAEVRRTIQELFEQILAEEKIVLTRPERHRLFEQIAAEILGFGPLQEILDTDDVSEVMVNGAKNIYIEKGGRIERVPIAFESDDHVMRIIDRIVAPLGRRIDESSPYVDARLPDGSRVNAVIPPISLVGPVLTIRKIFQGTDFYRAAYTIWFYNFRSFAVFESMCRISAKHCRFWRYGLWKNYFVKYFVGFYSVR